MKFFQKTLRTPARFSGCASGVCCGSVLSSSRRSKKILLVLFLNAAIVFCLVAAVAGNRGKTCLRIHLVIMESCSGLTNVFCLLVAIGAALHSFMVSSLLFGPWESPLSPQFAIFTLFRTVIPSLSKDHSSKR